MNEDEKEEFSFQEFLVESPLYSKRELRFSDVLRAAFFEGGVSLDAYCTACKKDSVFLSENATRFVKENNVPFYHLHGAWALRFCCQRDQTHKMHFGVEVWSDSEASANGSGNLGYQGGIIKYGQFPSHADLKRSDLKRFGSVLGQQDISEINRAIGLSSVGVSIGAFVYLRRVFERLVHNSFKESGLELSQSEFDRLKMVDKIAALEGFIPEFVFDNREIYGHLSKALHELSEEECADIYDVIKESVMMILEQAAERKSRQKRAKLIEEKLKRLPK